MHLEPKTYGSAAKLERKIVDYAKTPEGIQGANYAGAAVIPSVDFVTEASKSLSPTPVAPRNNER